MKYLVDTCVLSELMRPCPSASVCAWFGSVPNKSIYTSCLSIGEIRHGILRLPVSRRRSRLTAKLEDVILPRLQGRIVVCNLDVMELWAKIYTESEKVGRTLSVIDSLIAATALERDMTIVTRNVDDFQFKGLPILNPFDFFVSNQQ